MTGAKSARAFGRVRKKAARQGVQSEAQLQRAVVEFLQTQKWLQFFSVPNGGYRRAREMRNLKAQGLMPGAPDIVVLFQKEIDQSSESSDGKWHSCGCTFGTALLLELKSEAGKLTLEQQALQRWARNNSFTYVVVRSVEDVERALEAA